MNPELFCFYEQEGNLHQMMNHQVIFLQWFSEFVLWQHWMVPWEASYMCSISGQIVWIEQNHHACRIQSSPAEYCTAVRSLQCCSFQLSGVFMFWLIGDIFPPTLIRNIYQQKSKEENFLKLETFIRVFSKCPRYHLVSAAGSLGLLSLLIWHMRSGAFD